MSPIASVCLRSVPHWMVCAATLLVSACSSFTGTDRDPNRYASLSVSAKSTGPTTATANATLIFFDAVNVQVPNSALSQTDQCIVSTLNTVDDAVTGERRIGDAISLGVGRGTVSLGFNSSRQRYENPASAPIAYTTGDSATITIPSSSFFPAATLGIRLADPMIPSEVTLPAAATDWIIRWNGNDDGVSSVQLQLVYANPATLTVANEQLYCVLRDDGSTTLPSAALAPFLASPNAVRALRLVRWRTNELRLDERTLLHVASTIDTLITFR